MYRQLMPDRCPDSAFSIFFFNDVLKYFSLLTPMYALLSCLLQATAFGQG